MSKHLECVFVKKGICEALIQKFHDGERTKNEASDTVSQVIAILSNPPMYTTLRLNTLRESKEGIKKKLQLTLHKQCEERNRPCPDILQHKVIPDVLVIPSKGPMQWQQETKEVIVDHLCGCAVLRGADVFAQGIIGAPANMQKGDKVSVYADLDGKCKKGLIKPYEGRKVYVGNGITHYSRADLFMGDNRPSGLGVEMVEPLYEAPSLSNILPNSVFPQNLPSTVTAHVLDPKTGEVVLDMCAAPGGKTTHIATLMKNEGLVIAFDKTPAKIEKIKRNAALWNIDIIKTFVFDGTKALADQDEAPQFDPDRGPPFPCDSFDRILLDAPCSALGQRPCLCNKMTVTELESYPKLQKNLFSVAVELLKPGGILVYSTCTITLEENEHLVAWALHKFPQLKLEKQVPHIGGSGYRTDRLTPDQSAMLQRFDPSSTAESNSTEDLVNIDTIGFFIAKFSKQK